MAPTKKEQDALAEEQRRQRASVLDLAREDGMTGNRPGGATAPAEKDEKPKKEDK